ncbi:hypothetical protein B0H10DRAFT_2064918 [Mycena sp. CBHHK59/15]|nr:hypothetical protein B0H10DRAFT_2064918 [Mycena sp. CBHHK59/15]
MLRCAAGHRRRSPTEPDSEDCAQGGPGRGVASRGARSEVLVEVVEVVPLPERGKRMVRSCH